MGAVIRTDAGPAAKQPIDPLERKKEVENLICGKRVREQLLISTAESGKISALQATKTVNDAGHPLDRCPYSYKGQWTP